MKLLLLFITLIVVCTSFGQQPISISVKNSTLAAADSVMPFWFTANQDGKVRAAGSWLNLTDFYIRKPYISSESNPTFTWGVNAVAGVGDVNYYQLNRAYGGISWNGWELKGGRFYDPEKYSGLSATNGNLARSRNARPYPRLRLATRGYKPVPFLSNRLRFRAEYDEGLLNDNRFVDNTRLHHKSLYLRVHLSPSWELEGGLEHFVMWGGTSPVEYVGKMPAGFRDYLKYITGASGDESFPGTDQLNVAGNQLGTYQLTTTKRFPGMQATLYLSHPFEDLSGMNLRNWPDNLLGLHISLNNRKKFIIDVVYEYTGTRQQSIRGPWDRQEPDGYFNNGVYRSGFTYHRQMMGSPLFFPVIVSDGISHGIQSNRLLAHHMGMRGVFRSYFHWKGLLTWIQHEGIYFSPYQSLQKQLSGLLDVNYSRPDFPVGIGLSAGIDTAGNGENLGIRFSVSRTFEKR